MSRNPSEEQGETKPLLPNLVTSLERFFRKSKTLLRHVWDFVKALF